MFVVAALGSNSVLDVRQVNGAAGNVDLNGKVELMYAVNLPLATPAAGVAFLKYSTRSVNSNFSQVLGGAWHSFLAPVINAADTEFLMRIS